MDSLNIIFWMNIPSMIMAPCIKWLSINSGFRVECIFAEPLHKDRIALGWSDPDFGNAKVSFLNPKNKIADVKQRLGTYNQLNTIHLISGLCSYRVFEPVFLKSGKALNGIISEALDVRGLRGVLSLARARWRACKFSRRISFICAFGNLGVIFFQTLGFKNEHIFAFAYQAPAVFESVTIKNKGDADNLRLLFVGQQIERKGIDILLQALSKTPVQVSLTIAGCGPFESKYRSFAERLDIKSRINWIGSIPNNKLPELYSNHDVLVVPSRFDGWAAVSNEALMCGLPVIISDRCGAADLISGTGAGIIVESCNVDSLCNAIKSYSLTPQLLKSHREAAVNARKYMSSESIGRYLQSILLYKYTGSIKPQVPWRVT